MFAGRGTDTVPNAPCGVESLTQCAETLKCYLVPNAPCGVERPPKAPPLAVLVF